MSHQIEHRGTGRKVMSETRRLWRMPAGVFSMTPNQRDCLRVICEWRDSHGMAPSYAEIAVELDIGHRHAVDLVTGLVERGWLARKPRRHRGLTILHRPPMPDFTTPRLECAGIPF